MCAYIADESPKWNGRLVSGEHRPSLCTGVGFAISQACLCQLNFCAVAQLSDLRYFSSSPISSSVFKNPIVSIFVRLSSPFWNKVR